VYQEDYVLRQVSLAAQVIARILGLKKSGQYQQALQQIDEALQEFLGQSAGLVAQLSVSELIMLCRSGDLLDKEKAFALATLLKEEADVSAAESQSGEKRDAYSKSHNIALWHWQMETRRLREYLALVKELTGKLVESDLDSNFRYELSKYHEIIGDPAKARIYRRGLKRAAFRRTESSKTFVCRNNRRNSWTSALADRRRPRLARCPFPRRRGFVLPRR
jgi:hypothetical protein